MTVQIATTTTDIARCYGAMQPLRPHITEADFVPLVQTMQQEGYVLAYVEADGQIVAVAGYRRLTFLFSGRIIYIDDLSTLPEHRGRGYASLLLDHVRDMARAEGRSRVTLDSGHARYVAHKLYLHKGYQIIGHHFELQL